MSRPVVVVALAGAIALAGCATSGLPAESDGAGTASPPPVASAAPGAATLVPSPSAEPASSEAASPSAAVPPSAEPSLAAPPAARLGSAEGALASWTWDGAGDQAPWFVPADAAAVTAGAPLELTIEPAVRPGTWTARWAPVVGGQPGDIAATAEGAAGPVALAAPPDAGAWTLLVEARFGEGRSASWTWAVDVR